MTHDPRHRRHPVRFQTPQEALEALAADKLGTVYYQKEGVFVATSYGTGTFTYTAWREAGGSDNSQQQGSDDGA